MYVFAGVRARVFAFDGPAPAGGTGADGGGGQATPRTGFPPSSPPLFSSLLCLPLSLPPPSLLQPPGRATSRLVPSQLERRQWRLLQQT